MHLHGHQAIARLTQGSVTICGDTMVSRQDLTVLRGLSRDAAQCLTESVGLSPKKCIQTPSVPLLSHGSKQVTNLSQTAFSPQKKARPPVLPV